MRGLLCSTAFLLFSLSVFGSSDLVFRFITPVPSGDTDVADVEVSRVHGKNSVILDKTLEVFRSDYGFVYYNLFYPETASDSTLIINKARIRLPNSFRFRHGRHGNSGGTCFCFSNQKEWFVALFNVSSVEEDSSGMTLYSTEETLEEKWLQYDNMSKDEVFLDVHNRHPDRYLSRASLFSKKNRINGLCKQKKSVLFFYVKNKHKNLGIDFFSSFEIIDRRIVPNAREQVREREEQTRSLIQNPESYQAYDFVVQQEKSIIPELIPFIADTSIVPVPSIHPWNSNLPEILLTAANNRRGICFARLIDYYLSYTPEMEEEYQEKKDQLQHQGRMTGRFFFYHFYEYGIIVSLNDEGAIIAEPLEAADMIDICRQYACWWNDHKNESLPSLRKRFLEEGGILKGPYRWI